VRSFLGLVNFSAKFIPNMATVAELLRELTRKGTPSEWGKKQETAFQKLKDELSNAVKLAHFVKGAETEIVVDASPVGLGAMLVQKQDDVKRVISYASRSLSRLERRYSQTEIVPETLRNQVVRLAHEGRQGVVKTKQRMRSNVWWPLMDNDAEKVCKSCYGCQLVAHPTPPEPMKRFEMPN